MGEGAPRVKKEVGTMILCKHSSRPRGVVCGVPVHYVELVVAHTLGAIGGNTSLDTVPSSGGEGEVSHEVSGALHSRECTVGVWREGGVDDPHGVAGVVVQVQPPVSPAGWWDILNVRHSGCLSF